MSPQDPGRVSRVLHLLEHIAKGFGGYMVWINEPSRMMALDNEDDPAAPSQASSDNAPPISAFTVNAENDVLMISNT